MNMYFRRYISNTGSAHIRHFYAQKRHGISPTYAANGSTGLITDTIRIAIHFDYEQIK